MSSSLRTRVLLLAVPELIVGGIVVLGGAALVYFSTDTTGMYLGVVHAILGLLALPASYLLLTSRSRARTVTVGVDSAIIAFSTVSEIILSTTKSLPSGPFIGSIVGTVVAVLIGVVIIYQLMGSSISPIHTVHTQSAGQNTQGRTNQIEERST